MSNILFDVELSFNFYIIITILVCMIGMYGIGLAIGGFAVYYKQISSIVFIIQLLLLFSTDVLTKSSMPLFKFIPLTFCIDLIRKLTSGAHISSYEYLLYTFICFIFCFLGIILLNFMIRCAKRKGNLLHF